MVYAVSTHVAAAIPIATNPAQSPEPYRELLAIFATAGGPELGTPCHRHPARAPGGRGRVAMHGASPPAAEWHACSRVVHR